MKALKIKVPFIRIGGKTRLASKIIETFPKHSVFVDVFGGAGHIILRKPKLGCLNVYNDVDEEMYNLFKILQHKEKSKRLLQYLKVIPYSRQFFNELRDGVYNIEDDEDIQRAFKYICIMKLSFGGDYMNRTPTFACVKTCYKIKSKNIYRRVVACLPELRSICIEKLNYDKVITRYDSDNTLFYCDPPYIDREKYYKGYTYDDHKKLAELLNGVKGKVCISYYDDPSIYELYPKDKWNYHYLVGYIDSTITGDTCRKTTEVLITNY